MQKAKYITSWEGTRKVDTKLKPIYNTIDYIIISEKHKWRLISARSYNGTQTFLDHRLVKTTIINTKPYQRHSIPKNKNQQLLMSDSKHKKTYMHKTSELLAKNNNFQFVQKIFHCMRGIAKQCFPKKQAKVKP